MAERSQGAVHMPGLAAAVAVFSHKRGAAVEATALARGPFARFRLNCPAQHRAGNYITNRVDH